VATLNNKRMSGLEWIVEAHGCDRSALADVARLQDLFAQLVSALDLHPIGKSSWHQFPNTGGITGVSLLSESHLACHTFPEYGSLCLNLFCCRPRPPIDFEGVMKQSIGAASVSVRKMDRPYES